MKSVGILVAMKDELSPIRKRYKLDWTGPGNFFTGRHRGFRLQVALSGAGPHRASEAAQLLVKYGQPDLLIGVGLSGGLSTEVGLGDVVLASSVQCPGQPSIEANLELLSGWRNPPPAGSLLTLAKVLTTRAEKAEVDNVFPECLAVDMETYSLAQAAHQNGLPWLSLRAISDPWNRDLPLDFNLYLNDQGQASIFPLLKGAARDWKVLGELMRFGKDVFHARDCLMAQLDALLEVLPN